MQALTSRFTKKRPSGLRPEGRISAVPPSFTSERHMHQNIWHIRSNASCPVTWTNRKNLCQILLYIDLTFLGSSAQKLPSMISVLSTFQPAQNVSPSYGPDALSESFRHVLLFLMPLNICLFLSTILKCIGWLSIWFFNHHNDLYMKQYKLSHLFIINNSISIINASAPHTTKISL